MKFPENKKIVIYGDERYSRDFMYLFDDLKIAAFVGDERNSFADFGGGQMKSEKIFL